MPDLRLIIVGGHPKEHTKYYLDVVNFLEKKQLTEHVRILGYIQDAHKTPKRYRYLRFSIFKRRFAN